MLAAEDYSDISACGALPRTELPEVHRSKISLHHAKADYRHPTIRLPHTFSKLAGLPTRIYQTLHEGALAFLVVIACFHSATEDKVEKSKNIVSDSVSRAFTRKGSRAI
ncbi:MAG: hypothetical protein ACXV6K_08925 [Halobacteriota archaeon]